ncbi:hypothetical protein CcaCcLH18_12802 [Colletotrichum camelliae]|nr:hypothetical protein CcaCcLH18_12802 [Colletotrichum camelliae]
MEAKTAHADTEPDPDIKLEKSDKLRELKPIGTDTKTPKRLHDHENQHLLVFDSILGLQLAPTRSSPTVKRLASLTGVTANPALTTSTLTTSTLMSARTWMIRTSRPTTSTSMTKTLMISQLRNTALDRASLASG